MENKMDNENKDDINNSNRYYGNNYSEKIGRAHV